MIYLPFRDESIYWYMNRAIVVYKCGEIIYDDDFVLYTDVSQLSQWRKENE